MTHPFGRVILFGTAYLGKKELWIRVDTCPHCLARCQLAHYTAAKYVKIAGISLLPLGNVRIEGECRLCRRRRYLPLPEWQRRREQALEAIPLQAPAEVLSYLETVLKYSAQEDLQQHAQDLSDRFSDHPHIMALLGNAFSHFREWEQADAFFEAAGDSPECECLRALDALRRGYPDEAAPKLEFVFQQQLVAYRDTLYLLVEAYQARGQMEEAGRVLERIESAWPSQAHEPEHKWYRKRNRGKKHLPTLALKSSIPATPFLAQPVVYGTLIPLALCYVLVTVWAGQNRPLYLLNGSDVPYDIEIAGGRRTLVPGRPELIHIAEGTIPYKILDSSIPSGSIEVQTSWPTRAFRKRTFLFNPDEMALLHTERNGYSKRPVGQIDDQFTVYPLERLHEFVDIDYPFEDFPQEIMISEGHLGYFFNDVTYLRRLDVFHGSPAYLFRLLNSDEDRLVYLVSALRCVPSRELVDLAEESINSEKLLDEARRHLEDSPVAVAWHLIYQDLTWSKRNLEAEYRERLQAAPDDADLQFLLARITGQFEKLAPSQFLLLRQAESALAAADFATAENLSQSRQPALRQVHASALLAQHRYRDLLQLPLEDRLRMLAFEAAGQLPDAQHCIKEASPTKAQALQVMLDYAQGHPNQQSYDLAPIQLMADLCAGRADKARPQLESATSWRSHLSLYLLSRDRRDLARAIECARHFPPFSDRSQVPELLRHPDPRALKLALSADEKRLLLAALCLLDPKRKAIYAPLGRKLNFEKSFPYWTIKQILE